LYEREIVEKVTGADAICISGVCVMSFPKQKGEK
jgi:hypothetical protein